MAGLPISHLLGLLGRLALLVALAACGGPKPPPNVEVPPEARAAVEAARADLARRTSEPLDTVRIIGIEPTTWPNAALGCPEPGKSYAQLLVPGFRLTLWSARQTYEYHADRGGRVVWC